MQVNGLSSKGQRRNQNQDQILIAHKDDTLLAMVCDGIGGSSHGQKASEMTVSMMKEAFESSSSFFHDYEVDEWIRYTLNQINRSILDYSREHHFERPMGTTAAGILLTPIGTYIFHSGDSRIYALYEDGLIQMSQDHSVLQELIQTHHLSRQQALEYRSHNQLTNALGIWRIFKIDVEKIDPLWRRLLLCSDGLHGYVPYSVISSTLEKEPFEGICEKLVDLAEQAGGWDNCSVIVVDQNL